MKQGSLGGGKSGSEDEDYERKKEDKRTERRMGAGVTGAKDGFSSGAPRFKCLRDVDTRQLRRLDCD